MAPLAVGTTIGAKAYMANRKMDVRHFVCNGRRLYNYSSTNEGCQEDLLIKLPSPSSSSYLAN